MSYSLTLSWGTQAVVSVTIATFLMAFFLSEYNSVFFMENLSLPFILRVESYAYCACAAGITHDGTELGKP
jgi:hypothetical protein